MNKSLHEEISSQPIRILIIDDNSPFVLPILRSFSEHKNIHIDMLLSSDKKANHFRYSRFLGKLEQIDKLDDENIETSIKDLVSRFNSDLIIPTREWLSILLFHHKEELEKFVKIHPLPDASTLEITGDKWNLNLWLKSNGFPYAITSAIANGWQGDYPLLLKPVFGIGGKGIRLVDSPAVLKSLLENYKRYGDKFFLQEYIEGYDIDCSFFAEKGKIIYYTIQQGLISEQMEYSKGIKFVKNEELLKQVSEIVQKLNYNGIAHLDFRYDEQKKQYILIDFNSRYWSSVQGSRAMGINFPYLAVMWTYTQNAEALDYRTGYYYFSSTALKKKLQNLFSKTKYPVRLKDTQLSFIYKDPIPELMCFLNKLAKFLKGKRKENK